jgi:hypothetical protein
MTAAAVVRFPVKKVKKDRPALTSIVDLRGQMAGYIQGTASSSATARAKVHGVSLPPMSFYDGKPCRYVDGCLYVGDEVIRRRKI